MTERANERAAVRFLIWWRRQVDEGLTPNLDAYLDAHPDEHAFRAVLEAERDALGDDSPETPTQMRIGRYRILRELGRGGQGVVYLAQDPVLPREVAIKVLHPYRIGPEARGRLGREAEALARIEDPALATVYEAELDAATPYLVMQYVPGRSLQDLLAFARRGEPTVPPLGSSDPAHVRGVVALVEACARALERAHQAGVVHRDIKPGNVLVTDEGEPVLIDFGLARDDSGTRQHLTDSGDRPGTPRYMSPEQLWSEAAVDARSDIWSVGVTLYEALTLEHPFGVDPRRRMAPGALVRAIENRRPRSARRVNPGVPDELDWILERCLEQEPERRYATMGELGGDLGRFLRNEPVEARPPSLLYRSRKLLSRHRAPAAAALFVAGLFLGQQLMHNSRLATTGSMLAEVQAAERSQRQAVFDLAGWLAAEVDFETMSDPLRPDPQGSTRAERTLEMLRAMVAEQGASDAEPASPLEQRLLRSALANAEGEFERTLELLGPGPGLRPDDQAEIEAQPEIERFVLLALAHALRDTGATEAALACCDRLVEVMPDPANTWINRGNILADLGRPDEALASYDRGLELDPDSAVGRARRGQARAWAKDAPGALEDFAEAVRLAPDEPAYRFNYATMLGNTGDPLAAIEQLDRVAALAPDRAHVYVTRGRYHNNARQFEASAADFDRAFELEPNPPIDWVRDRAAARMHVQDWSGAIEAASAYLELRPSDPWALEVRGISKSWLGDREGALADYDAAIEAGGGATVYMQRGTCLAYMERNAEALVDLQAAHDLGYRSATVYQNLSELLHAEGRTAEAVELLAEVTEPGLIEQRERLAALLAAGE